MIHQNVGCILVILVLDSYQNYNNYFCPWQIFVSGHQIQDVGYSTHDKTQLKVMVNDNVLCYT